MMGRQMVDQGQLFYLFNLEGRIPNRHLLRRINRIVTRILAEVRTKLERFYSDSGRPSIDPELLIRMLIVRYCYGIRSEAQIESPTISSGTFSTASTHRRHHHEMKYDSPALVKVTVSTRPSATSPVLNLRRPVQIGV